MKSKNKNEMPLSHNRNKYYILIDLCLSTISVLLPNDISLAIPGWDEYAPPVNLIRP